MSLLNNMFGAGAQQALAGPSLGGSTLEEERYNALAQQYQNNLAQSMLQTKQAVANNVYNQMAKGAQAAQAIPFNPNELEAYKIPLSNLVTLWQAKFGDAWVQNLDDDFWHDAMFRLKTAGKLEEAKHTWFRIKEDA